MFHLSRGRTRSFDVNHLVASYQWFPSGYSGMLSETLMKGKRRRPASTSSSVLLCFFTQRTETLSERNCYSKEKILSLCSLQGDMKAMCHALGQRRRLIATLNHCTETWPQIFSSKKFSTGKVISFTVPKSVRLVTSWPGFCKTALNHQWHPSRVYLCDAKLVLASHDSVRTVSFRDAGRKKWVSFKTCNICLSNSNRRNNMPCHVACTLWETALQTCRTRDRMFDNSQHWKSMEIFFQHPQRYRYAYLVADTLCLTIHSCRWYLTRQNALLLAVGQLEVAKAGAMRGGLVRFREAGRSNGGRALKRMRLGTCPRQPVLEPCTLAFVLLPHL